MKNNCIVMKLPVYLLIFLPVFILSGLQAGELNPANAKTSAAKSVWNYRSTEISLFGPDNPHHPTVWEGPLQIKREHTAKRYELYLVETLYTIDDILFTLSYSGNSHFLDMIDLANYAHLVESKRISSGKVSFGPQLISVEPQCECIENKTCYCQAAQVYGWNSQGLIYNRTQSRILTKKLLGSAFEGRKTLPESAVKRPD